MDMVAHVHEGWRAGELRVQHCEACDALQFPPRAVCLACRSTALAWTVVPPRGAIHTFTIVHRAPTPAFKARVPYGIALVDLAPGVRMMMNVEGNLAEIAIDAPVEIRFASDGDVPLPVARVAKTENVPS
jgi:uncharacterized OB-fold protein